MLAPAPLPALIRKRAIARLVLWFEQVWPAIWPALGVLGVYASVALLDLPGALLPWPRFLLLAAVLGLAAVLLWRGLRRVSTPTAAQADRRLERASGLRHRPLAALVDRPVEPSDDAAALWQVHLGRLAAQVSRLRVGRPRPGLPTRDRWALRGAVLLGLAAAWVMAGPDAGARLLRGFVPTLPAGAAAPGTLVQAWVTPPTYTGLPPVFLRPDVHAVPVPTGSHLTVSVTGGHGEPSLVLGSESEPFRALDGASWQAERDLVTGGTLSIQRRGGTAASWALTVIPDRVPTVGFTDPPGAAQSGGRSTQQTRMAWRADDDYGIVGMYAELRLRDREAAPPVLVPITLAGAPKRAQAVQLQDLTAHPWAGLTVLARLTARDAPGQTGVSADAAFVLPERAFQHPLAIAVLAVRRQLSLTPDERRPARMALEALADAPDNRETASGVLLNLRAIGSLLTRGGRGSAAVDEAQARMWELALALEEGAAERSARALEAARQAVRDAVDANRETPEDRAELERRMQELREAIQRHLEALAEQARREGTELPYDSTAPKMNSRDLDRMAEQMRDAAREGRMDEAQQQMAELEKLLQQLQNARPERGEAQEQKNAERRQRGRQQMDAVQDMVRREGGLLDRSQTRATTEPRRGQLGQPSPGQPSPGQPAPGSPAPGQATPSEAQSADPRGADARAQRALRRALGELMQRFGDLTGQVPPALGEADMAMREAGQALADGRDAAAGSAQTRAIEALQKGGKEMGQQMARQFGTGKEPGEGEGEEGEGGEPGQMGEGGQEPGNRDGQSANPRPGESPGPGRRRSARRDPMGRPLQQGTSGTDESGDVRVPDQMEQARTRAIQDELRRRGAERGRPQPELDYIDRLLKAY